MFIASLIEICSKDNLRFISPYNKSLLSITVFLRVFATCNHCILFQNVEVQHHAPEGRREVDDRHSRYRESLEGLSVGAVAYKGTRGAGYDNSNISDPNTIERRVFNNRSSLSNFNADGATLENINLQTSRKMSLPNESFDQKLSHEVDSCTMNNREEINISKYANTANLNDASSNNIYNENKSSNSLDDAILNAYSSVIYHDSTIQRSQPPIAGDIITRRNSIGAVDNKMFILHDGSTGKTSLSQPSTQIFHQFPLKTFDNINDQHHLNSDLNRTRVNSSLAQRQLTHGPLPTFPVDTKQLEPFLSALEAVKSARNDQSYDRERKYSDYANSGIINNIQMYNESGGDSRTYRNEYDDNYEYTLAKEHEYSGDSMSATDNYLTSESQLYNTLPPATKEYDASNTMNSSLLDSLGNTMNRTEYESTTTQSSGSLDSSSGSAATVKQNSSYDVTSSSAAAVNAAGAAARATVEDAMSSKQELTSSVDGSVYTKVLSHMFPVTENVETGASIKPNSDKGEKCSTLGKQNWKEIKKSSEHGKILLDHKDGVILRTIRNPDEIDTNSLNGYENVGNIIEMVGSENDATCGIFPVQEIGGSTSYVKDLSEDNKISSKENTEQTNNSNSNEK